MINSIMNSHSSDAFVSLYQCLICIYIQTDPSMFNSLACSAIQNVSERLNFKKITNEYKASAKANEE